MNYRYVADNSALKTLIARKPAASLQEILRSHPALRTLSLDHLALRIDQLSRDQGAAWLK